MAQLNFQADPNQAVNSYDLLPKGKYLAMAIASEMKDNSKKTGSYLQITFEVMDGPHKGRKIFDRLNIRNTNKVAEKIAMESLNALCLATNMHHLTDSEQLHDRPVLLDISIEDGKDGYDAQNRVKSYHPANKTSAAPAPVQTHASVESAAQPSTSAATPVWKQKKSAAA